MPPVRVNTLVVDTSVLPKRPETVEIQKFIEKKLKLDMTLVRSIQLHNVKNVVYIGITNGEAATRIAASHHLKHRMTCNHNEVAIQIPIYVESDAIDVKLHDLPEEIDDQTIVSYMARYGEVISIRTEVWRKFWPGCSNGVRVVKIKLSQSVPSYISLTEDSSLLTFVSHRGQTKTCRNCSLPSHPSLRCSEAAKEQEAKLNDNTQQKQSTSTNRHLPCGSISSSTSWPAVNQQNDKLQSPLPSTVPAQTQPLATTDLKSSDQPLLKKKTNNKKKRLSPSDSTKAASQTDKIIDASEEENNSDSSTSCTLITRCSEDELLDQVIKEVEEKNMFKGFDPEEKRIIISNYAKSLIKRRLEDKEKL